ncbi:hypothetical protein L0B53_13275 [Vibrio sp. SS-MA-C1-2]|uniref:hypothetical protein n=1 Tax=Vibrio sp. SS-MA-C1-2 TaxID=2908646 RepID=UPI001F2F1F3B|nr:hypothetical protein [Vibrio sp. SS-MA-C1-2]UJF17993.1 hypothetical protein L0B53_13275 [Vibrio sp. SS-MA-C1-2]
MFIKPFQFDNNAVIRRALITTCGLLLAWGTDISSPVFGVLIALPITALDRFSLKVLAKRYGIQTGYIVTGTLIAELFSASPFMVFALSMLFLATIIYRFKYWHQTLILPTMIFYYLYAVVNMSYDHTLEHSVYSLIECVLMQVPIAWLLFALFPNHKVRKKGNEAQAVEIPIKNKHFAFVLMVVVLLVFQIVNLITSIFCTLVVGGIAFSRTKETLISNVKAIIPIQVGGCLIGLFINYLLAIDIGNLLWAGLILLLLTSFYTYFASNPQLRVSICSDVNYENNILRATLVPLSLYTKPYELAVGSYYHRAYDMIITALVMYIIYWLMTKLKCFKQNNLKTVSSLN